MLSSMYSPTDMEHFAHKIATFPALELGDRFWFGSAVSVPEMAMGNFR